MRPATLTALAACSLFAGLTASSAAQLAPPAPVVELPEQQPLKKLELHASWSKAVAYSPDGKLLAVGSNDQWLSLWNVADGKLLGKGRGHRGVVTAAVFAEDGKRLFTSANDGDIVVWQVEPLREVRRLQGHQGPVECLAADGKRLLSGGADGVRVWNPQTGEQQKMLDSPAGRVFAVCVLPQRKWVVAGASSGELVLWRDLEKPPQVLPGHRGAAIRGLDVSPDGARLAAAASDGKVSLWDAGRMLKTKQFAAHAEHAEGVAFSPDGRLLATAGGKWDFSRPRQRHDSPGQVRLWEVPTGTPLARLTGNELAPLAVAFSPSGRELAAVGGDHAARLWKSPLSPAAVLPAERQLAELKEKMNRVAGLSPPTLAALHAKRGYLLVQLERWQDAVTEYSEAAKLAPSENMHLLRAGILARLAGDAKSQVASAKSLAKLLAGDSGNMYLAERVLKVCALSDPPVGDRDHLTTLAEQSVARSANLAWGAYFPTTAALMHYRLRQYDKALSDVAESRRRNTNPRYRPHLPELANLGIVSMCLTQRGKLDEAAQTLQKMAALMDKHRGAPISAGQSMFHDWLTAELLYVEARDLLHHLRHNPPVP